MGIAKTIMRVRPPWELLCFKTAVLALRMDYAMNCVRPHLIKKIGSQKLIIFFIDRVLFTSNTAVCVLTVNSNVD